MSKTATPELDAPGAGLPTPELWIARILFGLKSNLGSREKFIRGIESENEKIHSLLESIPLEDRNTRVLVPRLRGLEDSSRHWSAWMTLEHLRITNTAFARFITTLANNKSPKIVVDTAAVKPSPDLSVEVEKAFDQSCEEVIKAAREAKNLKSQTRHRHPWFGELDAFRWLALASLHLGIHRAQIEAIRSALPR